MVEAIDTTHEGRAKWPTNPDAYELQEVIGRQTLFQKISLDFIVLFRSRGNRFGSSCNNEKD